MRGFTVIVESKPTVSYPARGCALLDGDEALRLMRTMQRRGLDSIARTEGFGIVEDLMLADMETIYDDQREAK